MTDKKEHRVTSTWVTIQGLKLLIFSFLVNNKGLYHYTKVAIMYYKLSRNVSRTIAILKIMRHHHRALEGVKKRISKVQVIPTN